MVVAAGGAIIIALGGMLAYHAVACEVQRLQRQLSDARKKLASEAAIAVETTRRLDIALARGLWTNGAQKLNAVTVQWLYSGCKVPLCRDCTLVLPVGIHSIQAVDPRAVTTSKHG